MSSFYILYFRGFNVYCYLEKIIKIDKGLKMWKKLRDVRKLILTLRLQFRNVIDEYFKDYSRLLLAIKNN